PDAGKAAGTAEVEGRRSKHGADRGAAGRARELPQEGDRNAPRPEGAAQEPEGRQRQAGILDEGFQYRPRSAARRARRARARDRPHAKAGGEGRVMRPRTAMESMA